MRKNEGTRILCSEEVRDIVNRLKRPSSEIRGGWESQEDVLRRVLNGLEASDGTIVEIEPREHVI